MQKLPGIEETEQTGALKQTSRLVRNLQRIILGNMTQITLRPRLLVFDLISSKYDSNVKNLPKIENQKHFNYLNIRILNLAKQKKIHPL